CGHTSPFPPAAIRLARHSVQHGARSQAQLPATARSEETGGNADTGATDPARPPSRGRRDFGGDPPTQQVVREELDEERGCVRVEGPRRDLTDAEVVLELGDERLDAGTVVVEARELVDAAGAIVRDVNVHGV